MLELSKREALFEKKLCFFCWALVLFRSQTEIFILIFFIIFFFFSKNRGIDNVFEMSEPCCVYLLSCRTP